MIHTVTITGADDNTNLQDLKELSSKYPFVEWGILFSTTKRGTQRYPSSDWIAKLWKTDLKLSAHICGALSKDILQGGDDFLKLESKEPFFFLDTFSRMQLNFNLKKYDVKLLEFIDVINKIQKAFPDFKVILQYNNPNKAFMDFFIKYGPDSINYLFDASGGNGVSPEGWPEPLSKPCGYAGGLNPDNLESEIGKILKVSGDTPIWIDAESGIRTNNELDLEKVERFLNIASKYVSK